MNLYPLAQKLLFRFDPEATHHAVMRAADLAVVGPVARVLRKQLRVDEPSLVTHALGLEFPNPVGLAAGFDKNAEHLRALDALGFGHIEIGTVTGEGQPGNDRPRLFRLPDDDALLNRMGFNNEGAASVARRLERTEFSGILGINIGKTKKVALEDAPADYEKSFRLLHPFASYFVVNVSSPNTPGLRELQGREPLTRLLARLQEVNESLSRGASRKPLLVKVAPDLGSGQLDNILDVVEACELDGVVATNTTVERASLRTPDQHELGPGGVSGRPVRQRSLEVIRHLHAAAPDLTIIGVGGIFDAADARETLDAGARLVQVWTGFIYRGPTIARDINRGL